jgi:hypothetical protein
MPLYSALKMEAVCFSETLVSAYKSTQRYNSEDTTPTAYIPLEYRRNVMVQPAASIRRYLDELTNSMEQSPS